MYCSLVSNNWANNGKRHSKLFTNCHVSWDTLYILGPGGHLRISRGFQASTGAEPPSAPLEKQNIELSMEKFLNTPLNFREYLSLLIQFPTYPTTPPKFRIFFVHPVQLQKSSFKSSSVVIKSCAAFSQNPGRINIIQKNSFNLIDSTNSMLYSRRAWSPSLFQPQRLTQKFNLPDGIKICIIISCWKGTR